MLVGWSRGLKGARLGRRLLLVADVKSHCGLEFALSPGYAISQLPYGDPWWEGQAPEVCWVMRHFDEVASV